MCSILHLDLQLGHPVDTLLNSMWLESCVVYSTSGNILKLLSALMTSRPWCECPGVCGYLVEEKSQYHFSIITIPMLRIFSSKAQGCKVFSKPFKPCHVGGIHWIALAKYSQLSTCPMCQGFSHFSGFLHNFVMAKLASSSILRDNNTGVSLCKVSFTHFS